MAQLRITAEEARLDEARERGVPWRKWGPYVSERQWGTVREDYSETGDAWGYVTHDQARSRAYRWGEDGLAGISDDKQRLCLALALWNGRDPILKERLFGLTNSEGNHGEDVKEYYFYLDATPSHAYLKWLYKYPQAAYPYDALVGAKRTRDELEYELLDTGVFDDQRYFDVFVEYAKESPEDLIALVTIANRGPEPATLHLLPTLWFRNTWAPPAETPRPSLRAVAGPPGSLAIAASHAELGERYLYVEGTGELLFTENETNTERIFGKPNATPYVKDAFHSYLVHGKEDAVNPAHTGTKAAAHLVLEVPAHGERTVRLRLTPNAPGRLSAAYWDGPFGSHFDEVLASRREEADRFYEELSPPSFSEDQRRVMRQGFAGMLWSEQFYSFDLSTWLIDHQAHPLFQGARPGVRNGGWFHMRSEDVISMPDKWEYPWYASWDLAFHTYAFGAIDPDFAREQLLLVLRDLYLHPNGQIPAYEWNFGDVNPPVQAWATLFVDVTMQQLRRPDRLDFLRRAFAKLMLNFTWWTNRKDLSGKNVFEGGFLGLDNIGVFDRSASLPTGGNLEQADGTAWMMLFSQNMLELALELSAEEPAYVDMAVKFLGHFLWIASAMDRPGGRADDLWDEEDGFFYDVLRFPDGTGQKIKVRSLVGLLPMCAATVIPAGVLARNPEFVARAREMLEKNSKLLERMAPLEKAGVEGRHLLSVLSERKLRRVLAHMLDEERFLSPHGIRSLSKWHEKHPYVFNVQGREYKIEYLPAESNTGMFGGNSNWRGPIWMPVNVLIIRALLQYYLFYGDSFRIECPTGSGRMMTLYEVAKEIGRRLESIFLRGPDGRRPVYGATRTFREDPHWKDLVLFYEYFHGDNGAGLGASHQTGWTGTIARIMQLFAVMEPQSILHGHTRPMMNIYRRRGRVVPREEERSPGESPVPTVFATGRTS
jgi:hypothetical protein